MSTWSVIASFLHTKRFNYLFGFLILVGTTALAMTIPKTIGYLTDTLVQNNSDHQHFTWLIIQLAGSALLVFGLKFVWRFLLVGCSRSVEVFMRDALFAKLQSLPVAFYQTRGTGDLIAHAISDVQAIRQIFGPALIQSVDGIIVALLASLTMAASIHPLLTLMCLAPVPLAAVLILTLRKRIQQRYQKVQESYADLSSRIQEDISGIRVLKSFAREPAVAAVVHEKSLERTRRQYALIKLASFLAPGVQICFGMSFFLLIVYGSGLVANGTITMGDFVAFNVYTLAIMGPVGNIAKIVDHWQRGLSSIKRLNSIFSCEPAHQNLLMPSTQSRPSAGAAISIRNLSFTYPGSLRPALRNLSLEIAAGTTLGIIGKTGSGKTTLVQLLLRLFPVNDGTILIDKRDINKQLPGVLRERIGCVPQDNFLFSTSIKENIAFYHPGYSQDDIDDATRLAEIHETIMAFPEGFGTLVGERGVTLSGGQKQRISIARAIMKGPDILILDDSLSAVDTATEASILHNLRQVFAGKTSLVISHRVSTMQHLDQVIMLDDGCLVEQGTHQSLLAAGGAYAKLAKSQAQSTQNRLEGAAS